VIFEKTNGNPFFSEQLAISMQESYCIRKNNGKWDIAKFEFDARTIIPAALQGVVTSRIDRLDASQMYYTIISHWSQVLLQRLTLKVASVIGSTFELRELAAIHPEKRSEPMILKDLESINLIEPVNSMEGKTFQFKNVIIQEIVESLLLNSQRYSSEKNNSYFDKESNFTRQLHPTTKTSSQTN
jgi:predicted ATPase